MDIPTVQGIPTACMPRAEQIPPFVRTPEDLRRWSVCFALSRRVLGYDSPHHARTLYHSSVPTDAATPA
jgi:hypothetical protein